MNEQGEKMFELAEQLKELKDFKKSTEQELKEINDKIDETEYRLSELMAETETQNFTGRRDVLPDRHDEGSAAAGRKEDCT